MQLFYRVPFYFQDLCIEIHCKFPKFYENGNCVDYVNSFGGTGFDIFIELQPLTLIETGPYQLFLSHTVHEHFTEWLTDLGITSKNVYEHSVSASIGQTINQTGDVYSTLDYYLVSFRIYFPRGTNISVYDNILAIHDSVINVNNNEFLATLNHWFESPLQPKNTVTNQTTQVFTILVNDGGIRVREFEKLTRFHMCAFVSIPVQDMDILFNDNSFNILTYNYMLSLDEIYIADGMIYICVETARELFKLDVSTEQTDNQPIYAITVLSVTCLIISILFGLIACTTIAMFKPLRTQPGVNNMLLAAYLVVSQVLFLFGFNQSSSTSASVCTVLGVLIHYTWLLLLVWMNTCTLHMVRVFLYHNTTVAKFNVLKTTAIYTLYCALVALVPVLINIIISTVNSSDNNIGYGGSFCYITGSDFHIYILSIPLAILILANIVLYVVVIVHIERTRLKRQPSTSTSDNRSLISAYMKMSTITGMTWIFGFVFMFTEQRWAEYMFVLLNATQGVFIFIAFIANKRVLGLYKELITRIRNSSITSSYADKPPSAVHCRRTVVTKSTEVSPNTGNVKSSELE